MVLHSQSNWEPLSGRPDRRLASCPKAAGDPAKCHQHNTLKTLPRQRLSAAGNVLIANEKNAPQPVAVDYPSPNCAASLRDASQSRVTTFWCRVRRAQRRFAGPAVGVLRSRSGSPFSCEKRLPEYLRGALFSSFCPGLRSRPGQGEIPLAACATFPRYIPLMPMPASRRAKLGLPICLNILRICAYCFSRLFTSLTLVPEPRAMRLRREPLMASW
jgi:hypothetical protein